MGKVYIDKQCVEFREPLGEGDQVVKIFFGEKSPRILMMYCKGTSSTPISMYAHEINAYIDQAKRELETFSKTSDS